MTIASDVPPAAFDCVKFILVREGIATLACGANTARVVPGDVIVVSAHTLCCAAPEPRVTVSTLYIDRDYLIDLVYWQCATHFVDRLEVKHFFDVLFTNHSQQFHLGHTQLEQIAAWLDELTVMSQEGIASERFYRAQSVLSLVLDALLPFLSSGQQAMKVEKWRTDQIEQRRFLALRNEARVAAELIRANLRQRWTLEDLATQVHLSPSQLGRVFVASFGSSPFEYLARLRVEEMALLLRSTNLTVSEIAARVGWGHVGYASLQFRRALGVTPSRYRVICLQWEQPPQQ